MTTVGTDIFQIVFTAGYASIFQYAIYGFIFYTLAMGMLLGSLLGIQIGDQFPDFDPRRHYALTLADSELTEVERNARGAASVDDIDLNL